MNILKNVKAKYVPVHLLKKLCESSSSKEVCLMAWDSLINHPKAKRRHFVELSKTGNFQTDIREKASVLI